MRRQYRPGMPIVDLRPAVVQVALDAQALVALPQEPGNRETKRHVIAAEPLPLCMRVVDPVSRFAFGRPPASGSAGTTGSGVRTSLPWRPPPPNLCGHAWRLLHKLSALEK